MIIGNHSRKIKNGGTSKGLDFSLSKIESSASIFY